MVTNKEPKPTTTIAEEEATAMGAPFEPTGPAKTNGAPIAAAVEPPPAPKTRREGRVRRIVMPLLLLIVLGFGANYGYHKFVFGQNHVDTDDAQVDGNIDPILPRVAGYVSRVFVLDNQHVHVGDLLVTLDTADLLLKIRAAETSLANAEAAVQVAEANVKTAQVAERKTEVDLARDTKLLSGGAITQQQFDLTKANADAAQAQLVGIEEQIKVAQSQVEQKRVDLDQSKLQLTYATIKAPASGLISRKNVQFGQYVQVGQPLMAVTEIDSIWITANFKETQVADIRPGQLVEIEVDAYPDKVFHGRVQSFAAATGAKFSLLPPDNATGNFVKVVQRVPIKILVEGNIPAATPLLPGMSVTATVTTK